MNRTLLAAVGAALLFSLAGIAKAGEPVSYEDRWQSDNLITDGDACRASVAERRLLELKGQRNMLEMFIATEDSDLGEELLALVNAKGSKDYLDTLERIVDEKRFSLESKRKQLAIIVKQITELKTTINALKKQ